MLQSVLPNQRSKIAKNPSQRLFLVHQTVTSGDHWRHIPPAAAKIYDANASTGEGLSDVSLGFSLAVPSSTYSGSYTSTWTITIASGP